VSNKTSHKTSQLSQLKQPPVVKYQLPGKSNNQTGMGGYPENKVLSLTMVAGITSRGIDERVVSSPDADEVSRGCRGAATRRLSPKGELEGFLCESSRGNGLLHEVVASVR